MSNQIVNDLIAAIMATIIGLIFALWLFLMGLQVFGLDQKWPVMAVAVISGVAGAAVEIGWIRLLLRRGP